MPTRTISLLVIALLACPLLVVACGDDGGASAVSRGPARGPWELVPPERVRDECGLDPDLLRAADEMIDNPWAVVRYGKLCHEHYPRGADTSTHVFSVTKTLGATVAGIAAYQTRDLPRNGRKTGPLSDFDRVDHWLDDFSFNPEAHIAHVLAMVGFNEDLGFGNKRHVYDSDGGREINRLSDVINTAIAQDPRRFGANLEEFTQRHVFQKLGMRESTWSDGRSDKIFGFSWNATVRDMARLGLLLIDRGVWAGERLLAEDWVYRMTHPAFEDANTSYGYLTWLASNSNYSFGGIAGFVTFLNPLEPCSPAAINATFPHGLSDSPDCNYLSPWTCEQENDVGVWYASGAGGHVIVGHPALDLVLIGKDLGLATHANLWIPMRPALIAEDPVFRGDEVAFCEAYGAARHAPDAR